MDALNFANRENKNPKKIADRTLALSIRDVQKMAESCISAKRKEPRHRPTANRHSAHNAAIVYGWQGGQFSGKRHQCGQCSLLLFPWTNFQLALNDAAAQEPLACLNRYIVYLEAAIN